MITTYQDRPSKLFRAVSILGISFYLVCVGCWLIFRKRIAPRTGLWRLCMASLRPPYSGALTTVVHEQGFCFKADLPDHLISDKEGWSRIVLYESGRVLTRAHSSHIEIRTNGNGTYSHWGNTLYFSASDNSDPGTNGRVYRVSEEVSG